MNSMIHQPMVLIILDGLGIPKDKTGSTWELSQKKVFKEIEKFYPFTTLQAAGIAVGLPWQEAGNSEVGHLAIGAGKIIYNYLPKISTSIDDETFFQNEAFLRAVKHVKKNNSALHLMGLFSTGTVHSYYKHLYALLNLAKQNEIKKVYLHLFTDGKDAYKKEAANFYQQFEKELEKNYPMAKIASVIGRKFAMDRDGNWERTQRAYNLFLTGEGNRFERPSSYIEEHYQKGIFDESIEPGLNKSEEVSSRIKENDALILYNFREDSMRQITRVFVDENFAYFKKEKVSNLLVATMTEYDKHLPCLVAFKSAEVEYPLARIISENGLKQLHLAESEKYAHITYFLNGGTESPFENEERILVPSPDVQSYDETPEMSAKKITEILLANLEKYDFIAVNFANADMVGHTGNFEATIKALETLDECVGKILEKVLERDGILIITSDHGNAEEKIYKLTGEEKTEHSNNPVPFYLIDRDFKRKNPLSEDEINREYKAVKGTLADIAPTILELMEIKKPAQMTGNSLMGKITILTP